MPGPPPRPRPAVSRRTSRFSSRGIPQGLLARIWGKGSTSHYMTTWSRPNLRFLPNSATCSSPTAILTVLSRRISFGRSPCTATQSRRAGAIPVPSRSSRIPFPRIEERQAAIQRVKLSNRPSIEPHKPRGDISSSTFHSLPPLPALFSPFRVSVHFNCFNSGGCLMVLLHSCPHHARTQRNSRLRDREMNSHRNAGLWVRQKWSRPDIKRSSLHVCRAKRGRHDGFATICSYACQALERGPDCAELAWRENLPEAHARLLYSRWHH